MAPVKPKVPLSLQFRALFLRNLSQQRRQTKTNCCQLLVPLVLLVVIGTIQLIVNNLIANNKIFEPLPPIARNIYNTVPCSYVDGERVCQLSDMIESFNYTNRPIYDAAILFALPYFLYSASTPEVYNTLGSLLDNGTATGFLGEIGPQFNFTLPDKSQLSVPFYTYVDNSVTFDQMNANFVDIERYYYKLAPPKPSSVTQIYNATFNTAPQSQLQNSTILNNVHTRQFNLVRPAGGVIFQELSNNVISYTVVARLHEVDQTSIPTQRASNIRNSIHNAYLRNNTDPALKSNASIISYIVNFPENVAPLSFDVASLSAGFCYGFASSFLLPVFVAAIVKDKQERHLMMMQMSGMSPRIYWIIAYLYNFLLYLVILVVIFATSFAFQFRIFTQTSTVLLLLLFLLWGNAMILLSFLLSVFFDRARSATVIGYIIVIAGVITANVVEQIGVFGTSNAANAAYALYPPFSFYRVILLMSDACSNFQCLQLSAMFENEAVQSSMLYIFCTSFIILPLTYYLSMVLRAEFGTRKPWYFIFSEPYAFFRRRLSKQQDYANMENLEAPVTPLDLNSHVVLMGDGSKMDQDVVDETIRIQNGFYSSTCPVVLNRLRKVYPARGGKAPHIAVRNISLAIESNECFGLLGANGAGKTTLIGVITGLFGPSDGEARIAGFDLRTEMDEVQLHIGVCPQFDILMDDLTCRETILFYARLKGVSKQDEYAVAESTLKDVNLLEAADRLAKDLSGGMKRRLSLAISILGNPAVIILDEPTTGLDPKSRREVWHVLEKVKLNRSVILTTHSMDEADTLCTRIGIMSRGRLMCIGSQLHLKQKFGHGYEVTIVVNFVNEQDAQIKVNALKQFMMDKFPQAEFVEAFGGTLAYRIAQSKIQISELFKEFEANKRALSIADWGVKMTTLEDVFVAICHGDEITD